MSRLSLAEVRFFIVKLIVSLVSMFLIRSYLREDREEAWFNGTGTGCYQAQSAPKFEVGSTWTNSMECAKWCIHQQEAHGLL